MIARRFDIRSVIAVVHDFLAVAVAWWLAYLLLFNFEIPASSVSSLNNILPWVMFVQAGICLWLGLYRGVWRYASLPDLKRILLAVLLGGVFAFAIIWLLELSDDIPPSIILLASILLLLIMGGSRLLYRAWKERRLYSLKNYEGKLVLVLGAGRTTISLVKDLERSRDWHVAGLLDDDPRKVGTRLHGVRVLGAIKDLPFWAHKLNVAHVIIAMPLVSHRIHRQALALCAEIGVKAMTVPSYIDLISGKTTVSQIRSIELDDLLGRAPVVLDDIGLHGLLSERTILITGAGGSIGSELCRQIITFKPDRLVLLELNEFALYSIEEEFRSTFPDIKLSFVIGDVKDAARLKQLFSQFHPTIVFHAAAYKHVPLMENENAWQALLNNVMGTYVLAKMATDFAVDEFVLISTDKAVNPINIMGASKRLAEMVCQAMQTPNANTETSNSTGKKKKHALSWCVLVMCLVVRVVSSQNFANKLAKVARSPLRILR